MVGQHPVRHTFFRLCVVTPPHHLGHPFQQRHEQVRVVVAPHPLHHRRESLQPQPGVDTRCRQRPLLPRRIPVELHEHQVPELQKLPRLPPPLELLRARHRSPFLSRPQVIMNLRARPAWPRIGHLPEVVLVPQPVDPFRRDPGHLRPQPGRVVVGVVHGDEQPTRIKPHLDSEKLPRVADRLALEVVPEGEISQHLEEGVVPRRAAHLLQVVVLAPRPHALLRGGRAGERKLLLAQKGSLELDHPGVGEEQCRVAGGDQRGTRTDCVAAGLEVLEESAADLGGFHRARDWRDHHGLIAGERKRAPGGRM